VALGRNLRFQAGTWERGTRFGGKGFPAWSFENTWWQASQVHSSGLMAGTEAHSTGVS
jgi:hypothetical protein